MVFRQWTERSGWLARPSPPVAVPRPSDDPGLWFAWRGVGRSRGAGWQGWPVGAGCPLLGVSLALGRAMLQAKATCLVMALPAKRREGQRMFWLLHFAWCCAKNHGVWQYHPHLASREKGVCGHGCLAPAGVSAQHRLQRTAASPLAGMRREPAK